MALALRTLTTTLRRIYPDPLADHTWDNTGLLLEPHPPALSSLPRRPIVLLTIDLSPPVTAEALRLGAFAIVAYHPPIFRPLKSLTLSDPLQASLLKLAQAGTAVYAPHTAVDATRGGVNDWLADGIGGKDEIREERRTIVPADKGTLEALGKGGEEGWGMGRTVKLGGEGVKLAGLVERVKKFIGMEKVMVVTSERHKTEAIKTIALCAGSGGSMFKGLPTQPDLLFTGELTHHDALAAKARGTSVIACFHTNTERGYLRAGMKPLLEAALREEWDKVKNTEEYAEVAKVMDGFEVLVSEDDRDPFEII